jgi:hypothetical protein
LVEGDLGARLLLLVLSLLGASSASDSSPQGSSLSEVFLGLGLFDGLRRLPLGVVVVGYASLLLEVLSGGLLGQLLLVLLVRHSFGLLGLLNYGLAGLAGLALLLVLGGFALNLVCFVAPVALSVALLLLGSVLAVGAVAVVRSALVLVATAGALGSLGLALGVSVLGRRTVLGGLLGLLALISQKVVGVG